MNILGLDIGTTSLSAVVVDAETGAALTSVTTPSASAIPGEAWEHLQHPEIIVGKALDMVAQLTAQYGPLAAIGLTGQMHGVLYVDGAGQSLSPLYTWMDGRGDRLMPGGQTYAASLSALTGHALATGYGAVTHYWHVVNQCVPEGAAKLTTIHDYVGMKLTGRSAPLTHLSDACSLGLFDRAASAFDGAALLRAGLDAAMFPDVARGEDCQGRTVAGVPVSVAIGDNQAGFLGTVREPEGSVVISVGTSGQVSMMSGAAAAEGIESRPLSGPDAILVGAALCGGYAYQVLHGFLQSCAALVGVAPQNLYEKMNELGASALELPDKLTVDTRLMGTRGDPAIRGAVTGLSTTNCTAAHLIGGVLEGIVAELHGLYRQMVAAGAPQATQLIGAGNALRHNPALRQAFERAFGLPLQVPAHREEAAYGAALFGLAAAGLVDNLAKAQQLIQYGEN